MSETQKKWIDEASYETLLSKWRFGAGADPLLQGEAGDYFKKVMGEKRSALADHGVGASKRLGW